MLRFVRAEGEACLMVAGGVPATTDGSHPTAAVARDVAAAIRAVVAGSAGGASGAVTPP